MNIHGIFCYFNCKILLFQKMMPNHSYEIQLKIGLKKYLFNMGKNQNFVWPNK